MIASGIETTFYRQPIECGEMGAECYLIRGIVYIKANGKS